MNRGRLTLLGPGELEREPGREAEADDDDVEDDQFRNAVEDDVCESSESPAGSWNRDWALSVAWREVNGQGGQSGTVPARIEPASRAYGQETRLRHVAVLAVEHT